MDYMDIDLALTQESEKYQTSVAPAADVVEVAVDLSKTRVLVQHHSRGKKGLPFCAFKTIGCTDAQFEYQLKLSKSLGASWSRRYEYWTITRGRLSDLMALFLAKGASIDSVVFVKDKVKHSTQELNGRE